MPNTDPNFVYDGFTDLSTGMDAGQSPSLIDSTSVAAASNVSFRGSYVHTRGGWGNIPITVPASLSTRWSGIWQGVEYYDGSTGNGQSGWVIQRGGLIFFLDAHTFTLQEITVQTPVTTTADFLVPGVNSSVTITVTTEIPFTIGQVVLMSSGNYTVTARSTGILVLTYHGGSMVTTVTSGTAVLTSTGGSIIYYDTNQANVDFAYMFQAEFYMIILSGQESPLIWDGSHLRRAAVNEIPPGVLGAYGWGRIWIALPNRKQFVAGNLVGDQGGGGTATLGFVDSILKFTENSFLNGGGAFSIPSNGGQITSMQFLATQDTSLGVGVLLVGTTSMVFSVNAPVDRTTWQNLSYPIQTVSLLNYGPEGPNNTVSVNGDMWYRALDGFRSFLVVRRYFGDPGNVPQSRELQDFLDMDTQNLLYYGSGIYFKNRLIQTVAPKRLANGVVHQGVAVLNFDLVSDLRKKDPPAWDGIWSGPNILRIIKGRIDNAERGFVFALNPDGMTVELWEMGMGKIADTIGSTVSHVASFIETKSMNFTNPFQLDKLYMGELYLDDIADNVTFTVKFKPDQYPSWVTWATLVFCATVSQCSIQINNGPCLPFKANARSYAARVTLPQPDDASCNLVDQGDGILPLNFGKEFQFRFEWTGHCEVRMFRAHCKLWPDTSEGQCAAGIQGCVAFPTCDTPWFTYSPYTGIIPIIPPANLVPASALYDTNGHFLLGTFVPGMFYAAQLGTHETQMIDPNGLLHTTPGVIFTFSSMSTEALFTGTANASVTANIFPIVSVGNLIPNGTNYSAGSYTLSVVPGAFFVLFLGANETSCVNGTQVIPAHSFTAIQAQGNTLVFSGAGAVTATVLKTNGVQDI